MLDKLTVADLLNNETSPITQFDHVWYSIPHCHPNILIIGLSYANILEKNVYTFIFGIWSSTDMTNSQLQLRKWQKYKSLFNTQYI